MSADGQLPMGVTHDSVSDPPPRLWPDDGEPHHAGDDDMGPPDGPVIRPRRRPDPDEPERLACRQCGKPWDEPRLSPDGVCPLCTADLDER